jgi:hypothetical protein
VDRSVKDLSSTMQKFEDKEKQAGSPTVKKTIDKRDRTARLCTVYFKGIVSRDE